MPVPIAVTRPEFCVTVAAAGVPLVQLARLVTLEVVVSDQVATALDNC